MAGYPAEKRELIDELMKTRRQAHRLFISLRFQGRDKEADQAEASSRTLTERIDTLLADALTSWEGKAKHLTERLSIINRTLEQDVERIRRHAATEQRIAAALGHLAEAVNLLSFWKVRVRNGPEW